MHLFVLDKPFLYDELYHLATLNQFFSHSFESYCLASIQNTQ